MKNRQKAETAAVEERTRCPWVDISKADYVKYHDEEWGVPLFDDRRIFEFLTLESAQAGLSWYTILRKRENYREAFDNFDPQKVALYGEEKFEELMNNPGIIRNRLKIRAAINNAGRFMEVKKEFGLFAEYIWRFTDYKPIICDISKLSDYPANSEISDRLSADLKKRGFKFLGSTVLYSHLQASGQINAHSNDCFRKKEVEEIFRKKIRLID